MSFPCRAHIYARPVARMDLRVFDVEVDGVVLPRWLFDDGNQQRVRTWLLFAGNVRRCGPHDDTTAFYAIGTHPFARLNGTALCLVLQGDFVHVQPYQTGVRLAHDAGSAAMGASWWTLEFDVRYVVSCAPAGSMTLCVRQRRPALADVTRVVLDRANRGQAAARRRAAESGTENAR